jgi:hypothetical protein
VSRWPPLIWLLITLGTLMIAVGVGGNWDPGGFIPGVVCVLLGVGLSLYLAYGRMRDRPSARGISWLIPAGAVFYALTAAAAALSGGKYVIAALAVALIPLTATALIVASTRVKTAAGDDGRRDGAAADSEDPFPAMGMDDATPLGDTAEHSEAERVATPDHRA